MEPATKTKEECFRSLRRRCAGLLMGALVFFLFFHESAFCLQEQEKKAGESGEGQEDPGEAVRRRSLRNDAESLKRAADLSKQLGVSLKVATFPKFLIFSALAPQITNALGDRLESVYSDVSETLNAEEPLWDFNKKCLILILPDRTAYGKYVEVFAKEKSQPAEFVQTCKRARGFYDYNPPLTVDYTALRPFREIEASILHKLGIIMLYRYQFRYNYLPAWLTEGFASYVEGKTLGEVLTFCFSSRSTSYADSQNVQSIEEKWIEFGNWPGLLKETVSSHRDTPLKKLFGMHINDLGYREVAKSWSFLIYLMNMDIEKFRSFLKRLRHSLPNYESRVTPAMYQNIQADLFKEIYGKPVEEIEEGWRLSIVPKTVVDDDG